MSSSFRLVQTELKCSAVSASRKVTIRPGFSGTVPIFNDVSLKKLILLGRPFVPFLAWCPGFV